MPGWRESTVGVKQYDALPKAARDYLARIEAMGGDPPPGYSSGGMRTKLVAAKIATQAGCAMAIALGDVERPLSALENGARTTWFLPAPEGRTSRKRWIGGAHLNGSFADGALRFYPQLGVLNIMQLATPESAILSAIIFNAPIIMRLNASNKQGTAGKADIEGYFVGGKTGTADKSIQVGANVIFGRHAGDELESEGKTIWIVQDEDILAVVK